MTIILFQRKITILIKHIKFLILFESTARNIETRKKTAFIDFLNNINTSEYLKTYYL